MEKVMFLFGRTDGLSVEEFDRHYLEVHAPLGLEVTQTMERYVVNLVDHDRGLLEEGGVAGAAPSLPVDAVTEVWTSSVAAFMDPARSFTSRDDAKRLFTDHNSFIGPMHAYRVTERVLIPRPRQVGEQAPGVKYVSLMYRADDLTHDEFDHYWRDNHGPLAVKHHVGMDGYVHNVVTEALTPDAPPLDGFVEMHFPTADDFLHRFFDSDEGREEIMADAYRFIGADTVSLLVDEHVMKL